MSQRILAAIAAFSVSLSSAWAQVGHGWIEHQIKSESLADALIEVDATRSVLIHLPPGYEEAETRYPTVYLLHGIFTTNTVFAGGMQPEWDIGIHLDRQMRSGDLPEAIYVLPDAGAPVGGFFYMDSEASGGWMTFIAEELVDFVDAEYRTIDDRQSRGVLGHSMGGFGAIQFGIQHPETFSVVYAMSPAALTWSHDLSAENPAWHRTLELGTYDEFVESKEFFPCAFWCLALAFSPNDDRAPLCVEWPVRIDGDAVIEEEEVLDRWHAAMPADMPDEGLLPLKELRALRIDVGQQEDFQHIIAGCRKLELRLHQLEIPHEYIEYEGDHVNQIFDRIVNEALPFFARNLQHESH